LVFTLAKFDNHVILSISRYRRGRSCDFAIWKSSRNYSRAWKL